MNEINVKLERDDLQIIITALENLYRMSLRIEKNPLGYKPSVVKDIKDRNNKIISLHDKLIKESIK